MDEPGREGVAAADPVDEADIVGPAPPSIGEGRRAPGAAQWHRAAGT